MMAAAASVDDTSMSLFSELQLSGDEEVRRYECQICLELLLKPKLLRCTGCHTFCEKCLQKHIDRYSFVDRATTTSERCFLCPVCKGRVDVPTGGAAGLQTNYYISDKVDRLRASLESGDCDICSAGDDSRGVGKRRAVGVCEDCSNRLCKPCSRTHSEHFPTHSVQRVSAWPLPGPDAPGRGRVGENPPPLPPSPEDDGSSRKCSAHPSEDLRFYCLGNTESGGERCDMVICRDCRMTDHFHHRDVTDLSKMADRCRLQLEKHHQEAESRVGRLRSRVQTLRDRQERVVRSGQQVETLLEARAQALTAAVKSHKDRTLVWLRTQTQREQAKVLEEVNVTQGALSSLEDVLADIQRAARAGSDLDKVEVCAHMDRLLGEGEQGEGGGPGCVSQDSGEVKGFLLNTYGPVSAALSREVLDDLLGKIVKL